MRNIVKCALSAALVGLAALAPLTQSSPGARADGGGKRIVAGGPAGVSSFVPEHQSTVRIRESDRLPMHKGIRLARNKSMLIEFPRDLRDVIVSNPEMMDAVVQSANRVYLIGKKTGQANVFFFDQSGEQIVTLEVSIEHDTAILDAMFSRLIPGSRIKSEMLNETIILTGSVKNPADSARAADIASRFIVQPNPETPARQREKVINLLAIEGEDQVMLKVVVAEMQRSVMKQLGINLGATITSGSIGLNVLTENALPLTAAAGLGRIPLAGIGTSGAGTDCSSSGVLCNYNQGPGASTFGNSGVAGGWAHGSQRITQALRMLERNGLIRTLAEPNLTAVSGETANFLAGGEYPIPVVDSSGKLSVSFKEFGIRVAFTPMVMSEGRINLKIDSEVSEITDVGAVTLSSISIPALKKRQAKSVVELPSGGTLAMAGLISEDMRQNIDGVPGLKDVAILGTLFRSKDFIRRETELVVMVTPYMVRPGARQDFARPDDNFAPASDLKANFLGHLNRVYGKAPTMPTGGLKGEFGFIVE